MIDKPAREVVISDYGTIHDRSLIHAIDLNIEAIRPYCQSTVLMSGIEYIFGYPVEPLLRANGKASSSTSNGLDQKFDVIFLADLIFNRSEHRKLLWTVKHALAIDGVAWITFSHHDPLKSEKDLHFFELAASAVEEFNFIVEFVDQEIRESYPFVEKDGMDAQRGIVYIYTLRHRKTTV